MTSSTIPIHPALGLDVQLACLHDLVRVQAEATPQAIAVTHGPASVSYGELLDRSRRLAARLQGAGGGPGGFIAVSADRSVDTIVALLGVLICGAAYVPVDPGLPSDRIRMIARDAAIQVATGADRRVALAIPAVWVPADESAAGGEHVNGDLDTNGPASAAYAIFTSGSTGQPKGVVVPHRAVVGSTLARFGVFPHENVTYLMLAPLSIDAAVAGLYFTLAAGGRVVVPTAEEVLDPGLLADLVAREAVSHLDGLPSQYAALLRFYPEALGTVRCVILGGESLPYKLVREHLELAPQAELYNEYGPTECTVWSTVHRCAEGDHGPLVPIGRPIAGVRADVLTNEMTSAPAGVTGEIHISGPGLAWGYLGRPGQTAERFVAHPDRRFPGERMYRTGDFGHRTPAGELVYHNRTDQLVKVRGFRVELGEVEARLLEHPDVAEAVVVAREGTTGVRLVAVVVAAPDTAVRSRALEAFLAERLPSYMLPALWRELRALPLTSAGKVDRSGLRSVATTVGIALPA